MRSRQSFAHWTWGSLLVLVALSVVADADAPQTSQAATSVTYRGVGTAVRFDVSPPLRELALAQPAQIASGTIERNDDLPTGLQGQPGPQDVDSLVQTQVGTAAEIPSPLVNFDGMSQTSGPIPPDPNGAVGPNHYVQMVNVRYAIYSKTGTLLAGPTNINTLWSGLGGACQNENAGDPIVLYDQFADRWLLSQLTVAGPTYYNCVALSTTPDPTGTYYRWAFTTGSNLPDYPKYGIWSDAYYISTREFAGGSTFVGIGAYALNRTQMIAGNPSPQVISFLASPGSAPYQTGDGLLPANLDGRTLPPAGTPEFYIGSQDNGGGYGAPSDGLNIWKFKVDFVTPSNSSLTFSAAVPVAAFDSVLDACAGTRACVPQPGTTQKVDHQGYRQRPLHRAAYRNFGSYQAIVTNQSVEASPGMSGIRWWELRSPNSSPLIFQEGTYAPGTIDGIHRWFGSIAQDSAGDMALGYSVSDGASTFPGIRYTGRLVSDAPGTMPQGEGTFVTGGGSQTSTAARWGDYSAMSVDPNDDCTFWYTTEYYATTSASGWSTRIGAFKFPSCIGVVPVAAQITSPTNGSTLAGSSQLFQWNTGTSCTQYWLYVGTTPGGSEILSKNEGTSLSDTVTGLPVNGSTIYVRLWSFCGGNWLSNSYTYTASSGGAVAAQITSPTNGFTFTGTSQLFQWNTGTSCTKYWLDVGTTLDGTQIWTKDEGTALSDTVTGLPTNGSTVYVRLWSLCGGSWLFNRYTYTAVTVTPVAAQITSPVNGTTLTSASQLFQWNTGTAISQYWLYVGTTFGGSDIWNKNEGTNLSDTVTGLPANITIYVRLFSFTGSAWLSRDYQYTGYLKVLAQLASPLSGSLLVGTATTFVWTIPGNTTEVWLSVGTAKGGTDIYDGSVGTTTSRNVTNLPTSSCAGTPVMTPPVGSKLAGSSVSFTWTDPCTGPAIWIRLWSRIGGVWSDNFLDYSFSTKGYKLVLGSRQSTPFADDIYNGNQGVGTSASASGLPTDATSLFGCLWRLVGGGWSCSGVAFTAAGTNTGFTQDFNTPGLKRAWDPISGDWLTDANGQYISNGLSGYGSSVAYQADYSTLDYTVVMKRDNTVGFANRLWIRGAGLPMPLAAPTNWWQNAYAFQYTTDGFFSVWKSVDSQTIPIQTWTTTGAIIQGANYNTLRVTANGSTMAFYINGTLVWTGTDPSFTTGRVGFGFFDTDWVHVDSATLTGINPAAPQGLSPEQARLNQAAQAAPSPGGTFDQSPSK